MHQSDKLTYVRSLPKGQRVLIALFGFVPLIAPYQLIIKVHWEEYFNLPFLFVLAICLGAIAVSLSLFFGAIMAIDSSTSFDLAKRTVTYRWSTAVFRQQQELWRFDDIKDIAVEEKEWSDGPPYYLLVILLNEGRRVSFAKYDKKEEANVESMKLRHLVKG